MKSSDLHSLWSSPDNTRVTNKQYSFRLPVHVAAKIAALCEMYPQKTRTELVGDLLATALDDLVKGMPYVKGSFMFHDNQSGEDIHEDMGPATTFWELSNKYYQELEREMGNENPPTLDQAMKTPKNLDQ